MVAVNPKERLSSYRSTSKNSRSRQPDDFVELEYSRLEHSVEPPLKSNNSAWIRNLLSSTIVSAAISSLVLVSVTYTVWNSQLTAKSSAKLNEEIEALRGLNLSLEKNLSATTDSIVPLKSQIDDLQQKLDETCSVLSGLGEILNKRCTSSGSADSSLCASLKRSLSRSSARNCSNS